MITVVLRGLTVLGLLGSAGVHLDLWLKGYRDIEIIGPLFLVNVVAGIVIAAGVLLSRHWLPRLGAVLFGAATLGAFVLSATVGFFGIDEQTWGPSQVWGAVSEVVCVIGGAALLDRTSRKRTRTPGPGAHADDPDDADDDSWDGSDDPTDGIRMPSTDGISRGAPVSHRPRRRR
jgi:hypothetical protein